jgi:hypothetical protein
LDAQQQRGNAIWETNRETNGAELWRPASEANRQKLKKFSFRMREAEGANLLPFSF